MVNQICTVLDETTYNHILNESSKRNVSKSKALSQIVTEYYSNDSRNDSNDKVMKDNETISKLETEITQLKHALKHKDEVIQMKDDEIQRMGNMAGFYGQQSTTIIEKLAGISDVLAKLLPAGPSQPPKDAVVVSDIKESEAKPKRSLVDRLLGRNKATSQN